MVLGTTTYFNYDPTNEEAKSLYARIKQIAAASLENKELTDAEYTEMKARLKAAESDLLYVNRKCKGDASETGLVQFAQAIYDLDSHRAKYPPVQDDKGNDVMIPFSSDIKFNLFVRDMSADNKGLVVYMKGAPERILTRCSKILIDGQE